MFANTKIDVSSFLPGLYLVQINDRGGMRFEKANDTIDGGRG